MIFTLKKKPQRRLDLSALTPDRLSATDNIAGLELVYGSRPVRTGDLFYISGDDPEHIELRRTTELVTRIGDRMTRGHINVKAHGGSYLGHGMRGGTIRVNGSCGDWLGCDMHWGRDRRRRRCRRLHRGRGSNQNAGNAGRPDNGMGQCRKSSR